MRDGAAECLVNTGGQCAQCMMYECFARRGARGPSDIDARESDQKRHRVEPYERPEARRDRERIGNRRQWVADEVADEVVGAVAGAVAYERKP
ncbi:hypothetical protein Busp01_24240 [Trinickia caryophylli]|nr:hypothetical protein Busp01_24240 [Trinickia caryophylli]